MKSNFKMTSDLKQKLTVFASHCKDINDAKDVLPAILNAEAGIENGDVIIQRIMHGRQKYLNQLTNPETLTEAFAGMKISSATRLKNKFQLLHTMMESIEYLRDDDPNDPINLTFLQAQEATQTIMSEKDLDKQLNQLHGILAKLTAARLPSLPDDETMPDKVIIRDDDVAALCSAVAIYADQMSGNTPCKNGMLSPEEIGIEVTFQQQVLAAQARYALNPDARDEVGKVLVAICSALIFCTLLILCGVGSVALVFYALGCESLLGGLIGSAVLGIAGTVVSHHSVMDHIEPKLELGAHVTANALCRAAEELRTFIGETIVPEALALYEEVRDVVVKCVTAAAAWAKHRFADVSRAAIRTACNVHNRLHNEATA